MAIEIGKLQEDGIIEPSMSPWRAQIVVVKNETNKQTKNKNKKNYVWTVLKPSIST